MLITSVVNPTDDPFDYHPVRSAYSFQERYTQTLETIASVRKRMPGAHLVLIECSPDSSQLQSLADLTDHCINLFPDDVIRRGNNKALGESRMLEAGINYAQTLGHDVFKISGRYVLTRFFDPSVWNIDGVQAQITGRYGGNSIHTFLYKIPFRELPYWKESLKRTETETCIEHCMHAAFQGRIHHVPRLGVLARRSSCGSVEEF